MPACHISRIFDAARGEELPRDETVGRLLAHVTQPQFAFELQWQEGDLVVRS